MGQVLEFKGPRRQRGFINLPDPMVVLGVGIAIGLVLGIALTLLGIWVGGHLSISWQ